MSTILGQNVRAIRKHFKLTQAQLADRVGSSQPDINKWETKGTVPGGQRLTRLAALAGWPADQLLEDEWSPEQAIGGQTTILVPVSLPNGPTLQRMFETMLASSSVEPGRLAALSRELAEQLPSALATVLGAPPVPVRD